MQGEIVDSFIDELQQFLECLQLQNPLKMEGRSRKELSGVVCPGLPRPNELQVVQDSSRFDSGTVYSPVTELSMNLGDLSTAG